MSSHIDFRTMPANVPVLCIPRVYSNISESRIRRIFDDLDMGVLERIDIVAKNSTDKGEKFNRVFIHFRRWNNTENANIARERLLNGKEIKIIYDDPWFWKISAYREAERKPSAPQNANHQRKATLQFDSDEDRSSNTKPVTSSYRRQDDRPRPDVSRNMNPAVQNRRRDDSRERRRPDDRRRDDSRERRRPDDRRRDDSRERRRPDDRHREERRRPDDRRREERRRPDDRRREERRRPDDRHHEERREDKPAEEQPKTAPRSFDNEDLYADDGLKVNYGDISIPFIKKKFAQAKKALKIVVDEEEKVAKEEVENA